jgi:mannosyltransferase
LPPPDHIKKLELSIALSVIALGIALRLWMHYPIDFWEDEIIASTHAVQPFWQVIISCLRFDVHPPLYFLQLHLWGLISRSDIWLTLNSLIWSLVALVSIWWVALRLYGGRVALIATAIFAVLPSPIYMADQLRMYAMLASLIVWLHYLTVRNFEEGKPTPLTILLQMLLSVVIVYTHAIGFMVPLISCIYAFYFTLPRLREKSSLVNWLAVYGIAGLSALPMLANDVLHDANILENDRLQSTLKAVSETTIGIVNDQGPSFLVLGMVAFGLVVAIGASRRETRPMTLVFLVGPLLLSAGISLIFKPLFKWNLFSTLEAPYLAMVPALVFARSCSPQSQHRTPIPIIATISLFITLLFGLSIATKLMVRVSSGFRDRANLVRDNYQKGDLIFTPQMSVFRGLAWYLVGPNWGSVLDIGAPPSAQWRSIFTRLGPRIVNALHLLPKTQILEGGRFRILNDEVADQAHGATRVWLLTMDRADLPTGYPPATLNGLPQQWSDRTQTWIALYASKPQTLIVRPPIFRAP